MLFHKDKHSLVEIDIRSPTARAATLSLEMQNVRDRRIIIMKPHFLCTEAEIQVFTIHEVIFIKAIQLFINVTANAEERTTHGIHFDHFVGIRIRHVVRSEQLAFREKRRKPNRLRYSRNRSRERTAASPLD